MKHYIVFCFIIILTTSAYGGEIDGVIYESGQKLKGVSVTLADQTTTTNTEGRFVFTNVSPGDHLLRIVHPDGKTVGQRSISVLSDRRTPFIFDFSEEIIALGEVNVYGKPMTEWMPSKQAMKVSEALRVTGAANDPLRALQILPGITAPNSILAGLFIRGGGPEDNAYYFDRVFLSYPYHFSGLATTINSSAIKSVDVFAGGFGAEFGNAQAIIDIQAKSPEREKLSFASDLNMLMSELMLESPIGSKGAFYVAGRRSYADLIVPSFIDIPELTKFPQFWDYQTGFDYDLTNRQKLHFGAFSANDSMEIALTQDSNLGDDNDGVDSDLVGKSHYINGFGAQSLTMDSSFGENLTLQSTLSHRTYTMDLNLGSGHYYFREKPAFYAIREDVDYEIGQRHRIEIGGLFETGVYNIESYFPRIPSSEEQTRRNNSDNWDFDESDFIRSDMSERFTYRDGYLQDHIALTDWLSLKLGTRASYFNKTGDVTIDPRANISIQMPNGVKLRSAYGIYHQNPTPAQILPKWGNPDVYASKATHYVLELERDIFHSDANIKVAGYYKDLKDLITEHTKDVYRNQGTGYAQGLEMLIKYHSSERFLGWLSYTYSLSRRKDNPDASWQLYIFDQTHVATLSISYKPTPNWELGMRWSYNSGTPVAPDIGELRKSANHRLDLRFARIFHIGKQPLLAYLDILNAYNYGGAISTSSDAQEYVDYQKQDVTMPVVPYLGVSMKF
jgi:hypothetical protein